MKTTGFRKFAFAFEVWSPVVTGSAVTYTKLKDDVGLATRSASGVVTLVSRDAMAIGAVVRNLRDADGVAIQTVNGTTYDLYVNTSDPEFNVASQVVGWRHSLRRTAPRDFATTLADIASGA